MTLPINISDLINRRVVEDARVEYKSDWNPEPILLQHENPEPSFGSGFCFIDICL